MRFDGDADLTVASDFEQNRFGRRGRNSKLPALPRYAAVERKLLGFARCGAFDRTLCELHRVQRAGEVVLGLDCSPGQVRVADGRGEYADFLNALRKLVERAADLVLGADGGGAEALIRIGYRDVVAMAGRILPALRPYARPFEFPGWTPIAPDGTL